MYEAALQLHFISSPARASLVVGEACFACQSEKHRSHNERHTGRASQPARPAPEHSPEEGEVRATPAQHRTQAEKRRVHAPADMELETPSKGGSAEPQLPPLPMEPPPADNPARAKLLADVAKFTEKCQASLLFTVPVNIVKCFRDACVQPCPCGCLAS